MRILISADWQSDFDNLDLCEKAAKDVLRICKERNLTAVVIAGDLKKQYNPVDLRVTHFWMDFISQLRKQGRQVILVLGNHDRLGMYSEAQNWMPILERAGASVVHKAPRVTPIGWKGVLSCVPFSSSTETSREWFKTAANRGGANSILIFHNDLLGARYNLLGQSSPARLKPTDLRPYAYRWCLGGHIHLRQKIGDNIYYVGSPFATDWGEANQQKGYTVIEDDKKSFVPSSIPGWYDPSWPRFPKEKRDWTGARVRIHVPIAVGKSYAGLLDEAKQQAEKKYHGAIVYTVPEFKEESIAQVKVNVNDPDNIKIKSYVRETLPAALESHRRAIESHLLFKLSKVSQGLGMQAGKIEFLWTRARRFLSFDRLYFNYLEPGLKLIVAKNLDWMGRSNGGGKSNFLSPIPVALFGMTFKGQKHDGWALRSSKKRAEVVVMCRDAKGRLVKIERGRRPGRLQLFVNGKDQSSGMQSTSKNGTQGLLERLLGISWQTLANSVYIDQRQVDSFLSGTAAEQKKILERFQNLERFTKALEEIVREVRANERAIQAAENEKAVALAGLRAYKEMLTREKRTGNELQQYKEAKALWREAEQHSLRVCEKGRKLIAKMRARDQQHVEEESALKENLVQNARGNETLRVKLAVLRNTMRDMQAVNEQVTCPTCFQDVDQERLAVKISSCGAEEKILICKQDALEEQRHRIEDELSSVRRKIVFNGDRISAENRQLIKAQEVAHDAEKQMWAAKEIWRSTKLRRDVHKSKISFARRGVRFWRKQIETLQTEQAIFEYCAKAFSRNGVPAFLNAQLCVPLNKAAEHYSEVFTGKEIQVRFSMQETDFAVEVINAHGGAKLQDQSAGEMKMAAIIASFALRSIAPECNLLVLDEPGDGLDPVNAKAFAMGLKQLQSEFQTVLLTSHNPVIVGELAGESCITIRKKDGISEVGHGS